MPSALHHLIFRGIERKKIFRDDVDRDNFLGRLDKALTSSGTACYAWALLPNQGHLILRTGTVPLATVMRRLLTGYASPLIIATGDTGSFSRTDINQSFAKKIPIF